MRDPETERSKVNVAEANLIEVAAAVVWKVVETAVVSFKFDQDVNLMDVQRELPVCNLATRYLCHTQSTEDISLRGIAEEIADRLRGNSSAGRTSPSLGFLR